jgi:hypothetical protein
MMPAEFLGRVTGRELSWLAAYDRVAGPQGSDRDDWRFAWLALWIVRAFTGGKDLEAKHLYADLVKTLQEIANADEDERDVLIDDDLELMEAQREKVIAAIYARFGRPQKTTVDQPPQS